MGRVQIFAKGRDVTKECTVGLREEGAREILVRPDPSGWVFASLPKGGSAISSLNCSAKNFVSALEFVVPGDGRTTYFGHIRFDLKPETTSTISAASMSGIDQGMRSAPPTLAGAAIATGVGAVAMLLLSDDVAVGMPTIEVEDRTYEALAAYRARYRKSAKALVVSIAGSTFSSDPSISPSVQKQGDLIYTEASVGGIRLTWLAVTGQAQPKAALRVQRFVRKDEPCPSMKLVLDGREHIVPTASKTERTSAVLKQTVQGEMDLQAIRDVANAKHVVVDICGTARAFSALAQGATVNFADAYQALQTNASALPAAPPPLADPPAAAADVQ